MEVAPSKNCPWVLTLDANVDRSSYRNHKFYNEMENMPFFTSLKKPFSNKHNILWVHRFWRIRLNNKWLPSWNTKTNWEASLPLCLLQLFWLAQRTLMAKLAPLEPFMLTSSENWSFEKFILMFYMRWYVPSDRQENHFECKRINLISPTYSIRT